MSQILQAEAPEARIGCDELALILAKEIARKTYRPTVVASEHTSVAN